MGCAFIIIVIAFLLSVYVTNPIIHLSNHMRSIKNQGLITTQKYKNRNDEIGILFTEHDAMVNSLNHYIKNEYQNKLITLDAQMRALEAQINSHFLFNTLESINSIAEIEEVESISIMSLALGNMFRYSIKTKSELVSLQDELKHVQDYVSIQQIRFDSSFQILYDIQEGITDTKILKLILQPLVENSLYHGLNRCSIKGTISLSAYIEDSVVIIKIQDNGKGIPEEQLSKIKDMLNKPPQFTELGHREHISIGLKNIHTRIQLYYGLDYGLSIESIEGKGTSILIKVPRIERGDINV
jgi:two-component system sensor histidine kinase YesM